MIAEDLGLQGKARTQAWREALFGLSTDLDGFLSKGESTRLRERQARLVSDGFPAPLAMLVAGAPLADRGLNIIRLVEGTDRSPRDLAPAYARLGDQTRINWVYQNLPHAQAEDIWARIVLMDLRTELLSLQRELTTQAVALCPDDPLAGVDHFVRDRAAIIARVKGLITENATNPTSSALSVVTQTLMRLRSGLTRG